ncbi:MAG: NADH dehydrogenase FAD-containing subunit, partial [Planctomycetes bacterium]|nr:NADH dehydrogenase FAD-containing subunit [Planctomycetota bacterium]
MLLMLILIPLLASAVVMSLRQMAIRRVILVGTAVAHTALTGMAWIERPAPMFENWLVLDAAGLLFLSICSLLFLMSAIYAVGYLRQEASGPHRDREEGALFVNEPDRVFITCLLGFLSAMTLVCVSQHFTLLWVGVEATTLASAPLIYFHKHHRSLEATWKYILLCSVGIALALMGNFALAAAGSGPDHAHISLVLDALVGKDGSGKAAVLDTGWLKAAFLFFLVGYGTKMGMAPLHTWLPDAHSEAPSLVSALLSGALLNCAFLGIIRAHQVCIAAGQAAFSQELLVFFGLFSMCVAAVFIIGQADFKRLLAYSSVEHMGILTVGVGLGGAGAYGAGLHALAHSFTKACLFLTAGLILMQYQSKRVADVTGLRRTMPVTNALWVAGFFSIVGAPPFGTFLSEFTILKAALDQGRNWVAGIFLGVLGLIFLGMSSLILPMTQGRPSPDKLMPEGILGPWLLVPPAILCTCALIIGLFIPERL